MQLTRSTCAIFVIFFACTLTRVDGDEIQSENVIEADTSDVLEEVSIEAVDDDDSPNSITSPFSINKLEPESIFKPEYQSPSDNPGDTAVATVYPDFGDSLENGNASLSSNGTNSTNTTTPRVVRVKVACSQLFEEGSNETDISAGTVEIVNMTHLLFGLLVTNPAIKLRTTPSNCTIVLFYTHWCPWSAKAAPHFNALPRAFRNIRFAAIDSSVYTAINTYFGVLAVPSVVLFYNGKLLAKYNETMFNVNQLAEFISKFTDQKAGIRLNVTSADFLGPIPSAMTKGYDWYLIFSWVFIIGCFIYYMTKTSIWHRVMELMQNSWREAEAVASVPPQHFHQD